MPSPYTPSLPSLLVVAVLLLLCTTRAFGTTDKYRLVLTSDPKTTATVAWNQLSGANAQVYYDVVDRGTNLAAYANRRAPDNATRYRGMDNRFVRLKGLVPNTVYYFVVGDSEGASRRFWFRTAPADNARLSFIAGGDSRNNRGVRRNANRLVAKLKPHAVFFGGDMIDADVDLEWREWFDDWQLTIAADGRVTPIVPARGNHEADATIHQLFDTPTADSYYAMTWGRNLIRTYTLNSEISVSGNQLTWLTKDLNDNAGTVYKMVQYHKPMRPHTAFKVEGNTQYNAWARLFYDRGVRLVVDCDSHVTKTTYAVRPSAEPGNDEGFVRDPTRGTVYTGEGCWGAPLTPADDNKSWTRASGSFNQFKLLFVGADRMELRTIRVDNAAEVAEGSNTNPFALPAGLDVWSPPTGAVVEILPAGQSNVQCKAAGTGCDDDNANTRLDEEDGKCVCVGVPGRAIRFDATIATGSDDAEERLRDGLVMLNGSALELIRDPRADVGDQLVGLRFTNVSIPRGAAVYRAYLQFQTQEATSVITDLTIHGELTANSPTFTATSGNVNGRGRTAASTPWPDIPTWATVGGAGLPQRTPYLTEVVTEILAQADWTSGNAMTFMISGSGSRVAAAFEGAGAARLVILYNTDCLPAGTPCDDGNTATKADTQDGNCNCAGVPLTATELTAAVAASSDDAEELVSTGAVKLASTDLELVRDTGQQVVGIRIADLDIPTGATIYRAYLQFTVDETNDEPTDLVIRGERSPDSPIFTAAAGNVSRRTPTTAAVAWDAVPAWSTVGEDGLDQRSPDLTAILSEIVDQDGWDSGNAVTFLIRGGAGKRVAESWDGGTAPRLKIFFESPCPRAGTACDDGNPTTSFDTEDGACGCAGLLASGTQTYRVAMSSDDASEAVISGATNVTDERLTFGTSASGGDQAVGIRFRNVNLPSAAVITRAYLQFVADGDDSGATDLRIWGEAVDDARRYFSTTRNVGGRLRTRKAVSWTAIPAWTAGDQTLAQRTPNLSGVLAEIISRPGWEQSGALSFVITGSGRRVAASFDKTGSKSAARLVIEYRLCGARVSPADFASFDVRSEGEGVRLDWRTATESNADSFIVERATSAQVWTTVTSLVATGNSAVAIDYTAVDSDPLRGLSYYRVAGVGATGAISYTETKSIRREVSSTSLGNKPALDALTLSPNPASGWFRVTGVTGLTAVKIFDARGVAVRTSGKEALVSTLGLPAGVYLVEVALKDGVTGRRQLVVQ